MDYNTVTELLNDQASQTEGETYRVKDASGWSTISHSGWAEFKKLATSTGAEGDYELRDQEDFDTAESVVLPIGFAASDEDTDLEAGTSKLTFRMPFAMTLTEVRANVKTAPTGSALIVDINETGVSILSTKLSIDISEKTSTTAATAAVISDANLADDAEITVDIDQVGSTVAGTGLKLWLIGTKV